VDATDVAHVSTNGARVREWQWLRGSDFPAVDRTKTVVYVTLSPLEVHGPHLPVAADSFEAEALATRAFELLTARFPEMHVLRLPPLFVAADVLPRAGSLAFRPSTLVRVVEDLLRTLSRQGFRHVWVGSFHGGPCHWLAIEKACALGNRRYGTAAVSLFSMLLNRLTGGSMRMTDVLGDIDGLSGDVLEGDAHAGVIETSLLLHLAPHTVAAGHETLPRRTLDDLLADEGKAPTRPGGRGASVREVLRWLVLSLKYYGRETYQGAPGAGTAAIGAALLERLAELTAAALGDLWTGRLAPKDAHTPLYKLRFVLLNEPLRKAFERLVGFRGEV
jgi:creatinine amidohydrolase